MICKAKTVKGSSRSIFYLYDDKGNALELQKNMLFSETPDAIYKEMLRTAHKNRNTQKYFVSAFFSPESEQVKDWTFLDWQLFAEKVARKLNLDKCQYVCTLHQSTKNKHIHLYACRIDSNGRNRFDNHNVIQKMRAIGADLDREYGWQSAQSISKQKIAHMKQMLQQCINESCNVVSLNMKMSQLGFTMKWQKRNDVLIGLRIISNDGYYNYKLSQLDRMKVSDILSQLVINAKQTYSQAGGTTVEIHPVDDHASIGQLMGLGTHQEDADDEILLGKKKKKHRGDSKDIPLDM